MYLIVVTELKNRSIGENKACPTIHMKNAYMDKMTISLKYSKIAGN